MTVNDAIMALESDLYDDFMDGDVEYKAKCLRNAGCSEDDIAAYLSRYYDVGAEPDETHAGETGESAQEESLKWTKRNAWAAIATLLVAVAALVVAVVSCHRM